MAEKENVEGDIRKRLATSGRVLFGTAAVGLVLFSLVIGSVFTENVDSELIAASSQLRPLVLSNIENFETSNDVALRKAAWKLVQTPLLSHIAIFDAHGRPIVWVTSPAHGVDTDNPDIKSLSMVLNKNKLMMETRGAELVEMQLPSGKGIYRAYTPVSKKGVRMGELEMGFFKSEVVSRAFHNLRTPAAVALGAILLLTLIAAGYLKRWENTKTDQMTEYIEGRFEKIKGDFYRKMLDQKREIESKEVDGGSFFNIMEAVRDISGATDLQAFVRRAVLASVRLFRCRMVSFYIFRASNGAGAWELAGRYDGKSYMHDVQEILDAAGHDRLKEALNIGATEILQGYPSEALQGLLISVSAEKPMGVFVLTNKVGNYDSKDLMAARVFAGFLPNLLSWHLK